MSIWIKKIPAAGRRAQGRWHGVGPLCLRIGTTLLSAVAKGAAKSIRLFRLCLFVNLAARARFAVANELDRIAAINEADTMAIGDGEWFQIAPYGEHRGDRNVSKQLFGRSEADKMTAYFAAERVRAGNSWRGIPIYFGHPDMDPVKYKDHRRIGRVIELDAREDGLWGKRQWNRVGQENADEGYHIYPSPYWDAPTGPEFRPDRLLSVGLTNFPRIATSRPMANADENSPTQTTQNEMNRNELIKALGLDADATDEDILAAIASLQKAADEAKPADPPAEKNEEEKPKTMAANSLVDLREELREERRATANANLDAAVTRGAVTEAERGGWNDRIAAANSAEDFAGLNGELKGLSKGLNTKPIDVAPQRQAVGNEQDRRNRVANAVQKRMADFGEAYPTAHAAVKADPEMKAVFDAMVEPSTAS